MKTGNKLAKCASIASAGVVKFKLQKSTRQQCFIQILQILQELYSKIMQCGHSLENSEIVSKV